MNDEHVNDEHVKLGSPAIVCAFAEGPGIGLGHRRRVEGLAAELTELGLAVELRPLADPGAEPGEARIEPLTGRIVLVDSYRVRADDRTRVRADRVIALDDLERDLAVDLVIDPDPGADGRGHRAAGAVLAGALYALVSPAVRDLHPAPVAATVRRVLVATGAADAGGIGAALASRIAAALPAAEIRQAVGPWGAGPDDPRVVAVVAPDGLGPELAAADIVATAGGVTMLEACCLGRPTVAFAISPDQHRSVAGAAQAGAVVATELDAATDAVTALAADFDARRRLARAARVLVDGQGSARVAAVIAGMARQGVHSR